jgi:hypothetical protein
LLSKPASGGLPQKYLVGGIFFMRKAINSN